MKNHDFLQRLETLLLDPDESGGSPEHYLRLASDLARFRPRVGLIPPDLLKTFCELIAAGEVPDDPDTARFFERILSRVPAGLTVWLLDQRFPVRPFIRHWDGKRSSLRGADRRRWRLLRKRLLTPEREMVRAQPCLEVTTADLKPLLAPRAKPPGAWKRIGARLLSAPKSAPSGAAVPPISRLYWEGRRTRVLGYWDRLVSAQAGELAAVGRLAREAGKATGRVVLSWHNASLAAAGGWGLEDIASQFPSKELYGDFGCAVRDALPGMRAALDMREVREIFESRARRIFAPKVTGGAAVDGVSAWTGPVSPHQRFTPNDVAAWRESAEKGWIEGLVLLFALVAQGQNMIDSGKISSFALPWIDKFFISSRRRADKDYLAALFRLVERHIERPLVLFWEDTAHARRPSFALALEDLAEEGLPFRGIGVFDPHGSDRRDALEIIRGEYPAKKFFALRPAGDHHHGGVGNRILEGRDGRFLKSYDSSWKDNLVFIYAGTQVFPLLSVQTEMEATAPWVSTGRERYPFGSWFRRRLRREAIGADDPADPLSLACSAWANLL